MCYDWAQKKRLEVILNVFIFINCSYSTNKENGIL
ncbi:MAG: hypothetical protein ACJAVE_000654 [Polaribacter sp.]|jgi:hypothetical protein